MCALFQSKENVSHDRLDLYSLVTLHPSATFYFRYEGFDLPDILIQKNDVLVIDRSVSPRVGNIVLVNFEGEFVIEKFSGQSGGEIWGVVCHVVHKLI
jgi:DNA polymerase V